MSENLIPVEDVTDEEKNKAAWLETHGKAANAVCEELSGNRPFVFVALGEEGTRVTALADRQGLEFAAMSVMTTLGADLLGTGVDHLPQSLGNNLKMAAGLAHIQRQLQALTAPHTPATDAGVDSTH